MARVNPAAVVLVHQQARSGPPRCGALPWYGRAAVTADPSRVTCPKCAAINRRSPVESPR